VGAGTAGLLLDQLLHKAGIETIIIEKRARAYVEARVREFVLVQNTVGLVEQAGGRGKIAA